MDHNVYELHAGNLWVETMRVKCRSCTRSLGEAASSGRGTYHEVNVVVIIDEVFHELLKAVPFFAHLKKQTNKSLLNMYFYCCEYGRIKNNVLAHLREH